MEAKARVGVESLKAVVDDTQFPFKTTEQVPGLTGIVGQKRGRDAMTFGLQVNKPGYNIYVAGLSGTGKTTYTNAIVREFAKKKIEHYDWCYVYNFEDKSKPKVLKVIAGTGKKLQRDMEDFIKNLQTDIRQAFTDENYQKEQQNMIQEFQEKSRKTLEELSGIAEQYGFILRQSGSGIMTIPIHNGEPISEEAYRSLDKETVKEIEEKSAMIREKVIAFTRKLRGFEEEMKKKVEKLDYRVAKAAVDYHMDGLVEKYQDSENILNYLHNVEQDILENVDEFKQEDEKKQEENPFRAVFHNRDDFSKRYKINMLIDNSEAEGAPVVLADNPTYYNLIGKVEYETRMGMLSTDFTKIKPGYLHQANGGYLIIQSKDILSNSFAWEALKRALKRNRIRIENMGEQFGGQSATSLKPETIPLDVKIIMIGGSDIYNILYSYDEDFRELFKIRADFDTEMKNNEENLKRLSSFIRTRCRQDGLRDFDRTAVAKVVEYSARLVGHQDKLSTRFNQLVEVLYEADTWAELDGDQVVSSRHVKKAIDEKQYRSSLYEEKLAESMATGDILIDTEGEKIGQVNGLAVYQMGEYSFGKPTRITASTYAGQSGIINIERESEMSGRIHNKGVYILSGYLGETFAKKHPLSLSANLAFEQSYGGVDGDSASSTELYALLSSLAEVPIKQSLAVTGSVNQKGEIQPIGGVNEKIEGFFDTCKARRLTGEQGVLIPHQNVKNLMLKDEVIDAVKDGMFHIYQVHTVEEGIELLTGWKAGGVNKHGEFEQGSLYEKVAQKLKDFMAITKNSQSK